MSQVMNLFLTYQFIKRLATPFDETEAFRLGLIDAKGKRLKYAKTKDEKDAMLPFDRVIFNMKRLLSKIPGGDKQIASYAAAILLLREEKHHTLDNLIEEVNKLKKNSYKDFRRLREEVPANATGAAVAGTGDDPVHWGKPKGRKPVLGRGINGLTYLRRRNKKKKGDTIFIVEKKIPVNNMQSMMANAGSNLGLNNLGEFDDNKTLMKLQSTSTLKYT